MAKDKHGRELKVGDLVSFPWRVREVHEAEGGQSFLVLEPAEPGAGNSHMHSFGVVASQVHHVHPKPPKE